MTWFFAYSNEIESYYVSNIAYWFIFNSGYYGYETYANVRFDVRTEEPIQYHADKSSFNQSVHNRLPDPTLGFTDNRGSDVLNVLQRFLDNTRTNLCGSFVYVLVERYPDEADVSHLINQLRANHVFVHFIAKATPSAGNNPKALCDISAATNGFCIFGDGGDFIYGGDFGLYTQEWPYQYISQNYGVSGSGRIEMPSFPYPCRGPGSVMVIITLQDHALDNNVSLNYTITSVDGGDVFHGPSHNLGQFGTAIIDIIKLNCTKTYKWTIDYSYPDDKPQRIEARMYSEEYQDFLPLPPI